MFTTILPPIFSIIRPFLKQQDFPVCSPMQVRFVTAELKSVCADSLLVQEILHGQLMETSPTTRILLFNWGRQEKTRCNQEMVYPCLRLVNLSIRSGW